MLTDDLKASVDKLTKAVDNLASRQLVTQPPVVTGGSVSDADVQAAITLVDSQSTRIDTLVTPTQSPAPATGPTLLPSVAEFANPLKT